MTIFLIGSDIYYVKKHRKKRTTPALLPHFSVIIPSYNEAGTVEKAVASVLENEYPKEKREVIIVDDGSTDKTKNIIEEIIKRTRHENITYIGQKNLGKANALNRGMKKSKKADLVMCLDADSYLDKNALLTTANYFTDPKLVALASNVKIEQSKGILNLIQTFEYLISYQMKRAQSVYNIEYIIGGIGSTFRKNFLEKIQYYDANTVTEDIDITMKILQSGNRNVKIQYASDVVTYTKSAVTLPDLIRQRFRWKWGRYQTFFKNRNMFFERSRKSSPFLTWLFLPYAVFSDIAFFLEPLIVGFIVYIVLSQKDLVTLLSAVSIVSFYIAMNTLAEDTLPLKKRLKLILLSPVVYLLFYVLSYVEYIALIKSWVHFPSLKKSILQNTNTWVPIKRSTVGI